MSGGPFGPTRSAQTCRLVGLLFLASCVPSDAPGDGRTHRTIRSAEPSLGTTTRVPPLLWSFGDRDGAGVLYEVGDALALSESVVLVTSPKAGYLLRLDRDSTEARPLLRRGRGPGEIMQPVGLDRVGTDTVYLFDRGNRRAQWLSAGGRSLRSEAVHGGLLGRVWPVGEGEEPRLLGTSRVRMLPGGETVGYVSTPIEVVALEEGGTTPIFRGRGRQVYLTESGGFVFPPLERRGVVVPTRGGFWYLNPDTVRAVYHDPVGEAVVSVSWSDDRLEVGEAEARRIADRYVEELATRPERVRRTFSITGPPRRLPAFESAHVDPSGSLWVVRREYGSGFMRFADIISPSGGWMRRVRLPTRGEVLDIGESTVVLLVRDALGVEAIQVHSIAAVLG